MIDIEKLYRDHSIPYETAGAPGVARGWIGTPCPFCSGNPGFHLGYCFDPSAKYAGAFNCWRCGGKGIQKALAGILSVPEDKVWDIVRQYSSDTPVLRKPREKKKAKECMLPPESERMKNGHRNYLRKRRFDPEELERLWGLLGTGPTGHYKHRIIIPIHFEGRVVSFQGRDITDKSTMKYKACPQEKEVIDHKDCLYGIDQVDGDSIVVTEGVSDVWRLGPGAVATFGIQFKEEQARQLLRFKKVFLLYDSENDDPQAGEQADKLASYLASSTRHVERVLLDGGDPGDLTNEEAQSLMLDLIR